MYEEVATPRSVQPTHEGPGRGPGERAPGFEHDQQQAAGDQRQAAEDRDETV
jgi:hypothetical protein